jgi:hypothetical protein
MRQFPALIAARYSEAVPVPSGALLMLFNSLLIAAREHSPQDVGLLLIAMTTGVFLVAAASGSASGIEIAEFFC